MTSQTAEKPARARPAPPRVGDRQLAMVAAFTSRAVVITDAQGRIQWVNDAFVRITGYTLAEVAGRKPGEVLQGPGTDPDAARFMAERIARGEGFSAVEILNYAKDGHPFWVSLEVQPVPGPDGRPMQYVAIQTDITLRREAVEALRVSEAKFSAAFHASADSISISTVSDGRMIDVNEAFERLSGFGREEVLGRTSAQIGLWADPEQRARLAAELRKGGQVREWPLQVRTRSGELRHCVLSASTMQMGGELCMVAVVRDVTDATRAEQAVRESERRLRSIYESSVDAIIVIDGHGTIELFNPACERMFGYACGEVIGCNVNMLMPEPFRSAHDGYLQRYRTTGVKRVIGAGREALAQRKNGEVFPIELAIVEIQTAEGTRFSGTVRDISARKTVEESARRLNEELKDSVAALEAINRENALLGEMRDLLHTCYTADEAHRVSAQFLPRLFPGAAGALYVFDNSKTMLDSVCAWGAEAAGEALFEPDACWSLRRGRLYEVPDALHGLCCTHLPQGASGSYICAPMTAQGEALGVLHVRFPAGDGDGDSRAAEQRRNLAASLSEHISLALANVRLRENLRIQATKDPLTGLYNRRYLEESFERELRRCARSGRPLTVWMLDVDHFKRFNDIHGHEAGDRVLRTVAETIRRHVRFEDIVCRYGGEEILVLLPEMSLLDGTTRAEAAREAVGALTTYFRDQALGQVTVSIGVSAYPEHGKAVSELVQAADQALYAAKNQGRDRVVVAA